MTFREQFTSLLADAAQRSSGMSRTYLDYGKLQTYVRVGFRYLTPPGKAGPELLSCIQIANVTVPAVEQNKGLFTRMLGEMLVLTDKPIFVEGVLTHRFRDGLIKRGFVVAKDYDGVTYDLVLWR